MSEKSTFDEVFKELRMHLSARSLSVPRGKDKETTWDFLPTAEGGWELIATSDCRVLERNFQICNSGGSIAAFLVCLAFWIEKFQIVKGQVSCKLVLKKFGDSDRYQKRENGQPLPETLHRRRSLFVLKEFSQIFGDRFVYSVENGDDWVWPTKPLMNSTRGNLSNENRYAGWDEERRVLRERAIELQMSNEDLRDHDLERILIDSFPFPGNPPEKLYSQLPIGLFDGEKKTNKKLAWTVGGTSEVDLWGKSVDGKVLHLIELKANNNSAVGIIPEAFYYARLLGYVRKSGCTSTPEILCDNSDSPGFNAAKNAEKVIMWLSSPDGYHPLVFNGQIASATPLLWLNDALKDENIEFRFLPYELEGKYVRGWI